MDNSSLSDRIRARLDALGKNPSSVALEAGLSRSAVFDILKGKAANPRIDTLQKLTVPLECSLEYLTGDSSEIGKSPQWHKEFSSRDTYTASVRAVLEVGVFRENDAEFPEDGEHIVYGDSRHPNARIDLYRIGDASLVGLGVHPGDLAHVLNTEHDEDFALKANQLVVVRRSPSHSPTLRELSARIVAIFGDMVQLAGRPAEGKMVTPILIRVSDSPNDTPYFENTFVSDTGDVIEIVGVVARTIRTFPV